LPTACFEIAPELTFFLSPEMRERCRSYPFAPGQSVKHLAESLGIPHTEIGQVKVNGQPACLEYLAQDGDRVAVLPNLPGKGMPAAGPRFVLDNHLGRLATYLRMLGFDCVYRNDLQDEELAQIASTEERILLSRDRRLLMRRAVEYGYCLRSLDSRRQVIEVLRRYRLEQQFAPFRRCLRCNALLERVSKETVLDRLEPLTRMYYEEFHRCAGCGQVYWRGSHYEHMLALIEEIIHS
jgi:uncharacterized protein with PIN domain